VNVLILGANGQLARNTTRFFLARTDARLTLYLRRARRLENPDPKRVRIVEGDVLDPRTLQDAMRGQDVVTRHFTVRGCDGVQSGMRQSAWSAKRPPSLGGRRKNGQRHRQEGTRSGSADAGGSGLVRMNRGGGTVYAAWRHV